MESKHSVRLATVACDHELEVVFASSDYDEKLIDTADVTRPGLQLTGFYDYFDPRRMQIMGVVEEKYLSRLSAEERLRSLEVFMSKKPCALVVCHRLEPLPECLAMARKYDVSVLKTDVDTSEFVAQLIGSLHSYLAPRITRHGVLVEVHGEGLLLLGESGVGKSETALELIKRGHMLIADDAVEIKRMSRKTLVGSAPEIIRYYMELRGVGVIDVRHIYGVGAVKPTERLDLVINMELWDENKAYDRLGIDTEYIEILGVKVPYTTIPVRPGRNLAVIMELAAMNNRQKKMGYNAALKLTEAHDRLVGD